MKPLYDKDCQLVGWVEGLKNIFDVKLNWVAFIENGNVFSSDDLSWLGVIKRYNCIDKEGKVVAWSPKHKVKGVPKPFEPFPPLEPFVPFKPLEPFEPLSPITPIPPLEGWSELTWGEWIIGSKKIQVVK